MTGRARGRARGRGRARETPPQRPGTGDEPSRVAPRHPEPAPQGAVGGAPPPVQQQMPPQQMPASYAAAGGPQGAVGGQQAEAPVVGSGRATYRGGKPPRPGNGQTEPPAEAMGQMSMEEKKSTRRYRPEYENVKYLKEVVTSKKGTQGTELMLKGNFFKLNYQQDWKLCQYHVDFMPPVENKKMRGALLSSHGDILGDVRAFDGMILFLPHRLPDDVTEFSSLRTHDNAVIKIKVRFTCDVHPGTTQTLQVMNVIWRRLLGLMGMKQINRHYYHMESAIEIPKHNLKVIPGFQTSILQYEHDVLLEIDISHKILRINTVLDVLYDLYRRSNPNTFHAVAQRELVGSIVMTLYNNKTYRIDDIDWKTFPTNTFDVRDGVSKTYIDYYRSAHKRDILDMEQPMLVSRPKKSDIRRGHTGLIYLVPELCTITGLTDEAVADYRLMNDVAVHTRVAPDGRVNRLMTFMDSLKKEPKVMEELRKWKLQFEPQLESIKARQLPQEEILMVDRGREVQLTYRQDEADWSRDMRGKKMKEAKALNKWLIVFPRDCFQGAKDLVSTLSQVAPPLGMNLNQAVMIDMESDRNEAYLSTLRQHVRPDVQMVVCILSNNKKDRYDAIKKYLCIDNPVPSQMVVKKTLGNKSLMSVATKIAIQMNCKMGGVVWSVKIPLTGTMIVGIDTYHDSSVRGRSCGGVVATMNADFTKYYSTTSFQSNHQELQTHLRISMTACLKAYQQRNGAMPARVIVYRDGVGDGQLDIVNDMEVPEMIQTLRDLGGADYKIQFTFIVVKKRINARFFKHGQYKVQSAGASRGGGDMRTGPTNPPPGTLIDDVATKPTWFDFFLVSQSVRQGTVGPTHYNIIYDTNGLRPDHYQRLTYKMTHMYYNWQGTIRVPAPCMYAHKLAFLSGQSLHRDFHINLADKLFFL